MRTCCCPGGYTVVQDHEVAACCWVLAQPVQLLQNKLYSAAVGSLPITFSLSSCGRTTYENSHMHMGPRGRVIPPPPMKRREGMWFSMRLNATWNYVTMVGSAKAHPLPPWKILNSTTGMNKLTLVKCASSSACTSMVKPTWKGNGKKKDLFPWHYVMSRPSDWHGQPISYCGVQIKQWTSNFAQINGHSLPLKHMYIPWDQLEDLNYLNCCQVTKSSQLWRIWHPG